MNGIKQTGYLLDTNVVLYLLQGNLDSPIPSGQYFLSFITEIELLSYSQLTIAEKMDIDAFLNEVTIIDIPSDTKQTAIELRQSNKLKLPDAIIAATAKCLNATLLTNDTVLLSLPDIHSQRVSFNLKG